MTMDARGFVTTVYRLAPPTERPGERIGSQLDAAYLAAVGEVVRAYGEVDAVTLVGVEITGVPHADDGAEVASVELPIEAVLVNPKGDSIPPGQMMEWSTFVIDNNNIVTIKDGADIPSRKWVAIDQGNGDYTVALYDGYSERGPKQFVDMQLFAIKA